MGVGDGSVVAADIAGHIGRIVIDVRCLLLDLTAGTGLVVIVGIIYPVAVAMGGSGDHQIILTHGYLVFVEVGIALAAPIVREHAHRQLGGGMDGGNLRNEIAVGMLRKATVGAVAGRANRLGGTGGRSAGASVGFLMATVACAGSYMSAGAGRGPCAEAMILVRGDGQLPCRLDALILVEQGMAYRAFVMSLHTRFGTVSAHLGDQATVAMGSYQLAVAGLPCAKIKDLIGAGLLGIELTAGALVVILPAVDRAGGRLAGYLRAVSVGVGDGSVVAADIAGRIRAVGVLVGGRLRLLTAGAKLIVVGFVGVDPLSEEVRRQISRQRLQGGFHLTLGEVRAAYTAVVVSRHTGGQLVLGVLFFYCRNQGAVAMGGRQLTVAGLPRVKIKDLIGAGLLGIELTAGATVVILPAVHRAGSRLAVYPYAVSVGMYLAACANHVRLDGGSLGRSICIRHEGVGAVDLHHHASMGECAFCVANRIDTVRIIQLEIVHRAGDVVVDNVARLQVQGKERIVAALLHTRPAVGGVIDGGVAIVGVGSCVLVGQLLGVARNREAACGRSHNVELDSHAFAVLVFKRIRTVHRHGQRSRGGGDTCGFRKNVARIITREVVQIYDAICLASEELIVYHVTDLQLDIDSGVVAIHVENRGPAVGGIIGGGVAIVGVGSCVLIGDLHGVIGDRRSVHYPIQRKVFVADATFFIHLGSVQQDPGGAIHLVAFGGDDRDVERVDVSGFKYGFVGHGRQLIRHIQIGNPFDRYAVIGRIGQLGRKVGMCACHRRIQGDLDVGEQDIHHLIGCLDGDVTGGHGEAGLGGVHIGKSYRSADHYPLIKHLTLRSCIRRQGYRCAVGGRRVGGRTVLNSDGIALILVGCLDGDVTGGHGEAGLGGVHIGKSYRSADHNPLVELLTRRSCIRRQGYRCAVGGRRMGGRTVLNSDGIDLILVGCLDGDVALGHDEGGLSVHRVVKGDRSADHYPLIKHLTLRSCIRRQGYRRTGGGRRMGGRTVRNRDFKALLVGGRNDQLGHVLTDCRHLVGQRAVTVGLSGGDFPTCKDHSVGSLVCLDVEPVVLEDLRDKLGACLVGVCAAVHHGDGIGRVQPAVEGTARRRIYIFSVEIDHGIAVNGILFIQYQGEIVVVRAARQEGIGGGEIVSLGNAFDILQDSRVLIGRGRNKVIIVGIALLGLGNREVDLGEYRLVGVGSLDHHGGITHHEGGVLGGSVGNGHLAAGYDPTDKVLAAGNILLGEGQRDRFVPTSLGQIRRAAADGDIVGNVAVDRPDADVAGGHDKGGRGLGEAGQDDALAVDDLPFTEHLALGGGVCRQGNGHAATRQCRDHAVNRGRSVLDRQVEDLHAGLYRKLQIIAPAICAVGPEVARHVNAVYERGQLRGDVVGFVDDEFYDGAVGFANLKQLALPHISVGFVFLIPDLPCIIVELHVAVRIGIGRHRYIGRHTGYGMRYGNRRTLLEQLSHNGGFHDDVFAVFSALQHHAVYTHSAEVIVIGQIRASHLGEAVACGGIETDAHGVGLARLENMGAFQEGLPLIPAQHLAVIILPCVHPCIVRGTSTDGGVLHMGIGGRDAVQNHVVRLNGYGGIIVRRLDRKGEGRQSVIGVIQITVTGNIPFSKDQSLGVQAFIHHQGQRGAGEEHGFVRHLAVQIERTARNVQGNGYQVVIIYSHRSNGCARNITVEVRFFAVYGHVCIADAIALCGDHAIRAEIHDTLLIYVGGRKNDTVVFFIAVVPFIDLHVIQIGVVGHGRDGCTANLEGRYGCLDPIKGNGVDRLKGHDRARQPIIARAVMPILDGVVFGDFPHQEHLALGGRISHHVDVVVYVNLTDLGIAAIIDV